ncbi:phosphomannomutase/phosphoglucomutase, partial [Escherichia coli]|nr:phosphomannomutase/phosphoglucomutase [Escherichia coli]
RMSAAFVEAVLDAGTDVVDGGLASTDELWVASGRHDLPGVMVTASHNPGQYTGIKFCHPCARPIAPDELVAIAERASAGPSPKAAERGSRSE